MDPNSTLARVRQYQRALLQKLSTTKSVTEMSENELEDIFHDAGQLADYFRSLDNWMSTGGFPPKDWEGK